MELDHDLGETKAIGSIVSQAPLSMDESVTVWHAIELMNEKEVGAIVITSALKAVGIFTERDVLNRIVAKRLDGRKTLLKEVMTSPVITMPMTALVGDVLEQMCRQDIRNMPIVGEGDQLVGFVSMPDVLQYARAFDIDEEVRRTWRGIRNFYDSQYDYTPG